MKLLLLSIGFNLSWLICVFGPWWSVWCCLFAWGFVLQKYAVSVYLVSALVGTGLLMDGVMVYLSVYRFSDGGLPFWLAVLWFVFTVYVLLTLRWLKTPPTRSTLLLVSVIAPMSYWVGTTTGRLEWPHGVLFSYVISALGWLIYAWVLHTLVYPNHSNRFKRVKKITGQTP